MPEAQRFPFVETNPSRGKASRLAYAPLTVSFRGRSADVMGLLDTGSAVNVLPWRVGIELGAIWDQQATSVRLTGNLAGDDARAILVDTTVGQFAPVRLAFAWTRSDAVPVILGQVNFFMEFDVCFFRSRLEFEVRLRSTNRR